MSAVLAPTLREVPAEAEAVSHQYLLRAGYIRRTAAGIYCYLPLAWRVLRKIEEIIRQEMDAADGQEVLLPVLQPSELWQESGRWYVYGKELFRLEDRHDRQFCLGPTHEEIITALLRGEVNSWRDLPKRIYQIQTKFRDEIRPRLGLIRCREFIMKDMYSFDRDDAGLDTSYEAIYQAYENIFSRCGLDFKAVEADSGAIGGSGSHEFIALADIGEDQIAYCPACSYAANVERAQTTIQSNEAVVQQSLALELVTTPDQRSIDDLTAYLGVSAQQVLKTLIYRALYRDQEQMVAVVVRGDRDVNEIKLKNELDALQVELASAQDIEELTGGPLGFTGPVNLNAVQILADLEVPAVIDAVVGANQLDAHLINANYGRDWSADRVLDLRNVVAGDLCPQCGAGLEITWGIEVGHVFKLGTKYSSVLKAAFLDENGQSTDIIMGCYGIGVPRTMAAVVEQCHDSDGIVWPMSIAPYQVIIVPVNYKNQDQRDLAEELYESLLNAGVECMIDDRDERAGVKFNDADLMGFPLRITVGPRSLKEGKVELRHRATGQVDLLDKHDVVAAVRTQIAAEIPQA